MMSKVTLGARYLLGLIFLVFGANGLMMIFAGSGFIPMPPPKPEMATIFGGLFGAVYLMPLVKIIEVVAGVMLLSGRYVPLALTLLGPVVVNILGLHLFVDLEGLPMALAVTIPWVILLKEHWSKFAPLMAR
jgi:putative oxidoreductase